MPTDSPLNDMQYVNYTDLDLLPPASSPLNVYCPLVSGYHVHPEYDILLHRVLDISSDIYCMANKWCMTGTYGLSDQQVRGT